MGTIYLALDLKHGRRVALKILPPDLAQAVGPERFLREIEISARLTHPHILSVHDSGQAGGFLYYVMPFVAGESLRERLERDGPLPLETALRIAAELADALAYAHGEGIIHRDVKPENVMLAGEHAFLADFGIARALEDPAGITESGMSVGTRRYASPEQAAGSRAVDTRSDLYSLGCLLYEMLAGPAAQEALEHRLVEPLQPITRVRPELPDWVADLIARATAQHPTERFSSAQQFAQALRRPGGTTVRRDRRGRQLAWIAGTMALLGLLAAALILRPSGNAVLDRERVLVASFENRTGDSALAVLGDIANDYIARGLAATRLTHDVFDARALAREAGRQPGSGAAAGRALATRLGAGTVLSGSYYREGDSLHFQAQVLETGSGKVMLSLEPVVGGLAEKTRVIELLRQRVMAGFAITLSPDFDNWRVGAIPPTYEAYQEMLAGIAANWVFDFDQALIHFRRAALLDSNFTSAQTYTALTLGFAKNCAGVDSIAQRLALRLPSLPPADRYQLEYATAVCRHDQDAALAASRASLDVAPLSVTAAVLGGIAAMNARRPADAIEVLLRYDPARAGLSGEPLVVYRDWIALAYHALGRHAEELEIARHGLREAPGALHLVVAEASALAGLGRGAEAESLATSWLSNPAPSDTRKGVKAQCVALELFVHGDSLRSRRLFERITAWYGPGGGVAAAREEGLPCLWGAFIPDYNLGRWQAARAAYQQLRAEELTQSSGPQQTSEAESRLIKTHAALGAIAARLGDSRAVRSAEAWLAAQHDPVATTGRARIALLLGDRDRPIALLRQAVDEGLSTFFFLHLDPDFAVLRDYPPYRELVKPRS
jgi:serine/threonine-protein kinase